MTDNDELKKIEEELKKSSKNLFGDKPKDVESELENETCLGTPDNLIDRSDENES